jgi:hypothetical protein
VKGVFSSGYDGVVESVGLDSFSQDMLLRFKTGADEFHGKVGRDYIGYC